MALLRSFAEHADVPIAMTLLGIGGFPASHPLNLGMMGMHGEAWVNAAIQEADLLLAFGMRFDDRVTGNLKTYATRAKKIHIDIDHGGDRQERDSPTSASSPIWPTALAALQPLVSRGNRTRLAPHRSTTPRATSPCATSRTCRTTGISMPRTWSTTCGATTSGNALVVTDVGQHQMWEAQYYHHEEPRSLITSGGLGTMGFALPAAIGAKVARPEAEVWAVVGDGGFQMTMARARDHRAGAARRQRRHHQQRLPRHGAAVAGVLLREALRRDAAAQPGLREAGGGATACARAGSTRRRDVIAAVEEARAHPGAVVIDFQVEQEDSVFPMVPAGADLHAMIRRPSPLVETAADD